LCAPGTVCAHTPPGRSTDRADSPVNGGGERSPRCARLYRQYGLMASFDCRHEGGKKVPRNSSKGHDAPATPRRDVLPGQPRIWRLPRERCVSRFAHCHCAVHVIRLISRQSQGLPSRIRHRDAVQTALTLPIAAVGKGQPRCARLYRLYGVLVSLDCRREGEKKIPTPFFY